MTHRPYTPPAWQSKPLADGRVTLLVVPLKVPAGSYVEQGRIWAMTDGCAYGDAALPYAPGDLIWCRESWWQAGDLLYMWRSPDTMPKDIARTWLRCTGVKVRRVQTISEDEVRRVGLEPNDGTVLRGKFNPWDANPWCAFTTVEKISKEDV